MIRSGCWLVACVGFVLVVIACPTSVEAQRGNRPPVVQSPVVEDGTTTFRIYAPEAETVSLTGSDFPGGGPDQDNQLEKNDDGIWSIEKTLPPGAYRYQFSVDGVPTLDIHNTATSQSNATVWSLVHVPGNETFDWKDIPHGAVSEVQYHSKPLDRMRRMHVYTPPGYEKGDQSYPVFYLLHGASDCDDSWSTVGRSNIILDNLIAQGKAKPMIVVMPHGHTGSFQWGGGGKPFDEQMTEFADDFNLAIRPYIESHYRVKDGRQNRAIAGLSMGGAQTLNIAIPNLQDYAYFGVFSSGVFGITGGFNREPDDSWEQENKEILSDPEAKKGLKLAWFSIGKDDFLLETSRATVAKLKEYQFEVTEQETDGGHTWKNWREYLTQFSSQLFQD